MEVDWAWLEAMGLVRVACILHIKGDATYIITL